jgi:hypothetical protein
MREKRNTPISVDLWEASRRWFVVGPIGKLLGYSCNSNIFLVSNSLGFASKKPVCETCFADWICLIKIRVNYRMHEDYVIFSSYHER